MENYPIFVDLKNQPCLVVGGGPVALRKIRLQLSAGARITVIAPELCAELESEFGAAISHLARKFEPEDVLGYRLITAATDDQTVNQQISHLAMQANILVNVVDQPELCSFITPSIVDRSPVLVAISTGGAAPVLARQLRSQIEALLWPQIGKFASALRAIRDRVAKKLSNESDRRRFWEAMVNGAVAQHYAAGRVSEGQELLLSTLDAELNQSVNKSTMGEVSLIGAGPGDPDLLTFRALRLMQTADVVLHDRLVSEEVLNLVRRDADRLYVGKRRSAHAVPQGEINQLLVDLALAGKRVVRLKGGDPFIFGRGGEEIELLSQHSIPFQIVPGITAASGCAAYAGIPLTHRDHAQSVLFVTGHLKDGSIDLDWPRLAAADQTVVIYMGLVGLPLICSKLMQHGMPDNTAIALVEHGTKPEQRVFTGTLASLPADIAEEDVHAPTLIIIGSVVSLHSELAWLTASQFSKQ